MSEPLQAISSDRAIELLCSAEQTEWQHDTGPAVVAKIRHPEHGLILVHQDSIGGSYFVRL